jgi:hypothetical protein
MQRRWDIITTGRTVLTRLVIHSLSSDLFMLPSPNESACNHLATPLCLYGQSTPLHSHKPARYIRSRDQQRRPGFLSSLRFSRRLAQPCRRREPRRSLRSRSVDCRRKASPLYPQHRILVFGIYVVKLGLVARLRSHIGFLSCSLAFLQLLGGHWAILQAGAWAGMAVSYSQQGGLVAGLSQTFDGEHPCPICKAIQDGQKQEQKKAPLLSSELKRDYLAAWNRFQICGQWSEVVHPAFADRPISIATEPAVPPPRS